jgi:hypothetical protein
MMPVSPGKPKPPPMKMTNATKICVGFSICGAPLSSQIGQRDRPGCAPFCVIFSKDKLSLMFGRGAISSTYREAVTLEGPPFFEVGGGVTTPVNFRIMPSDLLRT